MEKCHWFGSYSGAKGSACAGWVREENAECIKCKRETTRVLDYILGVYDDDRISEV